MILVCWLLLLGGSLRFYKLGQWSFWIDEILTVDRAVDPVHYYITAPKVSGILMNILLDYVEVNQFTTRLVPVIFAVLTIPLLYFFVYKTLKRSVAFWSTLIFSISAIEIYYAQNARYYAALISFSLIAVFLFYFWHSTGKRRYLVFTLLFIALAYLERGFGLLIVSSMFAYILLDFVFFKQYIQIRSILYLFAGVLAVYFLFDVLRIWFLDQPSFAIEFYTVMVGKQNQYPLWILKSYLAGSITLPVMLLALVGGCYMLLEHSKIGLLLICNALVPLIIVICAALITQTYTRYLISSNLSWIILAGVGLTRLLSMVHVKQWVRIALVVGVGLWCSLFFTPAYEDFVYFLDHITLLWIFAICFLFMAVAASILLFNYINQQNNTENPLYAVENSLWNKSALFIFMPFIISSVVMTTLYFSYQSGYRDDLVGIVMVLDEIRDEGESVVVHHHMSRVSDYYLQESPLTENILSKKNNPLGDVWIIEDFGLSQSEVEGVIFGEWASEHCIVVKEQINFVWGTSWPIKLHYCQNLQ